MNKLDFLLEMQEIDDDLLEEALGAKAVRTKLSKTRIAAITIAATMALLLVSCSIIVVTSEVYTSRSPDAEVNNRIGALTEPLTIDGYHDRLAKIVTEYGIAEEDILDKIYKEYIQNGYYFDEVILITKDTAIGRIITDAENLTFDVEFIGFFYNERTDEFKTISEKTTAPGGKIEIILNAERGWECFGGFLGRSHPETEDDFFNGTYVQQYGIEPSVRAMQFMDKYYDKIQNTESYEVLKSKREVANVSHYFNSLTVEGIFVPTEGNDPIARIEQVASAYEMEGISNGKTFYDRQNVLDGQFIEVGYAYDEDGVIAFINNTIADTTVEDFHVSVVFYNAKKDQYRTIWRHYSEFTDLVMRMELKRGWEVFGVYMYRSMPENDENEFIDYNDFTPIEGDEVDSQKFWERVQQEIELGKEGYRSSKFSE